ncbi:unnamed protein product [Cuscuta epithymum]|uniref:Uncharacterized protein n=1 Tax=Cuscuta epithymum TaxID=186058 RepID=A0AAV0FRE6_9ASTE|nr:unnamed protein product [Cuscuta epithymum]
MEPSKTYGGDEAEIEPSKPYGGDEAEMEPSKTYGGGDELGLGWRWEDIFGPSPGNTPTAMEGFENATEPIMKGHEDTTAGATEGVQHTPVGDEGTADVKADQGWCFFSSFLHGCYVVWY